MLTGYHHVTAITADLRACHDFMAGLLGLRLVKRSVNEDSGGLHLFYGDGAGRVGATLSFFHWNSAPEQRGTNAIVRVGFRIPPDSLDFWAARLAGAGCAVRAQAVGAWDALLCDSPDGLRLALIADPCGPAAVAHRDSSVPPEHQIRGLGAVALSVHDAAGSCWFLTGLMGMRQAGEWDDPDGAGRVMAFVMPGAPPGPAGEVHVIVQPDLPPARQGAGAVHHLAFCVDDAAAGLACRQRLIDHGVQVAPQIDRRYFQSIYFREPGGNLLEIATRGPGFTVDEPLPALGGRLILPQRLEHMRPQLVQDMPLPEPQGTGNCGQSGS
ncbi:MAG: VOC family protein [Paracoccus sp. (in: a-proteobacteria)]|uniref:VOC family protein n=1 Tax=Paracoccus sp. TaxID=267 RepID=UPI0026DF8299|nr:VOC family protein [Paracoccus sp. (in: a-proteobacteria)]MDO5612720.1 VOC family protein [Paracoccus sp. (in: a-proteobacteria)]